MPQVARQHRRGEHEAYTALETWRYHDNHLWRWESDQRKKTERMRQDTYRVFAAKLASGTRLLVSDAVYSEMARRPGVEGERVNGRLRGTVRAQRLERFARRSWRPSRLAVASREGVGSQPLDDVPELQVLRPGGARRERTKWECFSCDAVFDLDELATLNMLRTSGENECETNHQHAPGGQRCTSR